MKKEKVRKNMKEIKEEHKKEFMDKIDERAKTKVKFGMRGRVILVAIVVVLFSTFIFIWNAIPKVRDLMTEALSNNVFNLAVAYGEMVETEVKEKGALNADEYAALLKEVSISGYDTSYAYMVDKTGKMLYHPTAEKIGNQVENSVVSELVAKIEHGIYVESDVIEYDFKGVIKIAGFYVSHEDSSILIVTLDRDQFYDGLGSMYNALFIGAWIAIVISVAAAWFVAGLIAKPLRRLQNVAEEIANLNLSENEDCKRLAQRGDEAGLIARAMLKVQQETAAVVEKIADTSKELSENAGSLNTITKKMNENSGDNSATSEELAASMEETSATTDSIDSNVVHIDKNTVEINHLTEEGSRTAKEIMGRAEALKKASREANEKTLAMYQNVKEKTEMAIEQSKSVEKIQTLADAIMAIASQTSLLSLNASIEAARAGDMGRGFAVVAGEIGNLASQSTSTVTSITQIVTEVQNAVANMSSCLLQTLEFLENTVTRDYGEFIQVGEKYSDDAAIFDESMKTIYDSTNALREAVNEISIAISGINATISEAATGVSDIAEKTSRTVELTSDVSEMVEKNAKEADTLAGIVSKFTL